MTDKIISLSSASQGAFSGLRDQKVYDKIIVGGGLAAIFSAYEILREAKNAHKKMAVAVLAEKFSVPCTAGNQFMMIVEGLSHGEGYDRPRIRSLLEQGLHALQETVEREDIKCRLKRGYEIKLASEADMEAVVNELTQRQIHTRAEIEPSKDARLKLPGFDYNLRIDSTGQLNVGELLSGLIEKIRLMGGIVHEGISYKSQAPAENNFMRIETTQGAFLTSAPPLMATSAHLKDLQEFPFQAQIKYTMGLVFGPLTQADARSIAPDGPMAFCDRNISGDILWGGLDPMNYFTIGRGDLTDPAEKESLYNDLMTQVRALYPWMAENYIPSVSFGAMLVPENKMPTVGRLENYDICGGWYGMGIVPGYTAARAFSKAVVAGNSVNLEVFENLQPGAFKKPRLRPKYPEPPSSNRIGLYC